MLTESVPDAIAESVNTDGSRLKVGNQITLMGYGCTSSGGNGGNDGQLRVGKARSSRCRLVEVYDIVTKGQSALCYGDSGGPSFLLIVSPEKDFKLRLIAVEISAQLAI